MIPEMGSVTTCDNVSHLADSSIFRTWVLAPVRMNSMGPLSQMVIGE